MGASGAPCVFRVIQCKAPSTTAWNSAAVKGAIRGRETVDFGPTLTTIKILVPSLVWPPGYEFLALIGDVFN